jgi:hypothetical protein
VLLSRFAYNCAVYGGLVASVASAWIAIRHRERRVEPKLPPATTGRSFRRYLMRIAPVIVLLAVLGGEWAMLTHAHDVIVIDPGPSARREVWIGAEPAAAQVLGRGDTFVINRSERMVKLLRVEYGDYELLGDIASGSVTKVSRVDFLGPDARARDPNDLDSQRRTWLTWD